MVTPFNIMEYAKALTHNFHDSYLDEVLLREASNGFLLFKNRETFSEQKVLRAVCDRVVNLPCKVSDITALRFYDLNSREVFPQWVNRFTEENFRPYVENASLNNGVVVNTINNTSVQSIQLYRFNGRTIVFFDDSFEAFEVCVTYLGLNIDENEEYSFPDEYQKGLTDYTCYRYYTFHNNDTQQNMMKGKAFHEQYIFECNRLAGETGLMNTIEQIGIKRYTNAISRKNLPWSTGGTRG